MSNGNAGPNYGTGDHPSAEYINVAASTTSGTFASGRFSVSAPTPVSDTAEEHVLRGTAQFGNAIPDRSDSLHLYLSGSGEWWKWPANSNGCVPFTGRYFYGQARRQSVVGSVNFSLKVLQR